MARKPLIEPGSILPADTMLGRIVARDREKAGRREAETETTDDIGTQTRTPDGLPDSQTVSHMTSYMTDQQENSNTDNPDSQLAYQIENLPVSQTVGQGDTNQMTDRLPQPRRASSTSLEKKRVGRSPAPPRAGHAEETPVVAFS